MRAAVYARVSSATQRDRHTIESQLRVLPDFVRARGWELVGTYVDDGRSAKAGKLDKRGGFAALVRDTAAGLFDVVVVVDLDRLTRSEDITERGAVLGAFQRAGVKIAIATSGQVLDLSSSMGDLFAGLQAFFAAEENRKRSARIVEGKLTAISRGKKPSGPTPYGYRYDRTTGTWSIHEAEAAIVREVFRRAVTESAGAIADDLFARAVPRPHGGEWSPARVYATLRQPAYRGTWIADKRRKLTVPTPPIVTEGEWYAARDRAAAKARQLGAIRRTRNVYLCEDLAVCAICGARIGIASAIAGRQVPARYVCPRRRDPGRGVQRCTAAYRPVADVDARVWQAVRDFVLRDDLVEQVARAAQLGAGADVEAWRVDLEVAEKRLARLARAEAGILARYRRELVSEAAFEAELATIARERAQATDQAESARRAQFAAGRRVTRAEALQDLVAGLRDEIAEHLSPAEQRAFVRALVPIGGVHLGVESIDLDVLLTRRPAATTRVAPCVVPGSIEDRRSNGDDQLRFRLVA